MIRPTGVPVKTVGEERTVSYLGQTGQGDGDFVPGMGIPLRKKPGHRDRRRTVMTAECFCLLHRLTPCKKERCGGPTRSFRGDLEKGGEAVGGGTDHDGTIETMEDAGGGNAGKDISGLVRGGSRLALN